MKNLTRLILALLVGLSVISTSTTPVSAQAITRSAWDKIADGVPAGGVFATSDVYNPVIIKYIGTSGGGTVTTTINNNITLKTGPVGGSAADTTTECPVSGALGGVIDVTNAACDTLGEMCDYINASPNWRCVILDGVRSDSSKTINTLAETTATDKDGLLLTGDTDTSFGITRALVPASARKIGFYLDKTGAATGAGRDLFKNPFINTRTVFFKGQGNLTFGANATVIELISEIPFNKAFTGTPVAGLAAGSSQVVTEYQETGAATTVDKTLDFTSFGIFGPKDAKLVLRYRNTTSAATAGNLRANAQFYQYNSVN